MAVFKKGCALASGFRGRVCFVLMKHTLCWRPVVDIKILSKVGVSVSARFLFLIDKWTSNVYVYAVRGIGGLINEAQRNVKPDHLQTVPRYRTKLRNCF